MFCLRGTVMCARRLPADINQQQCCTDGRESGSGRKQPVERQQPRDLDIARSCSSIGSKYSGKFFCWFHPVRAAGYLILYRQWK